MPSDVVPVPALLATTAATIAIAGPTGDPVLRLAHQPASAPVPTPPDPTLDHADEAVAVRRADVDEKHRRLVLFLDACGYDAVVLGRADSLAWLTAGGDFAEGLGGGAASVRAYVNRQTRALLTDNVEGARAFEEEAAGLGFQIKERPWADDPARLVADLGGGRKLAGDGMVRGLPDAMERLRPLRLALTELDRRRLKELGRVLASTLEAVARTFEPGQTELEVAAQVAHRFLREGITPNEIRVVGDERSARFRRAPSKPLPIRERAVLSAAGTRQGLCAAATRVVTFGPPDPAFRAAQDLSTMVAATCIVFSRPGARVDEILKRARRIYEKFGRLDEWELDHQGYATGYAPREFPLKPDDSRVLDFDCALRWSPGVGGARSEDTVVIDGRGFEVVTRSRQWPEVDVSVKGLTFPRPDLLAR